MIECCNENIYYKKRPKRLRGRIKSIFLSLLILSTVFCYYRFCIINQLNRSIKNITYAYCTESVNKAILSSLEISDIYEQLINVEKNSNGEISLISTNTIKINKLNKSIANSTSDVLAEKIKKGVKIPIGCFFGISIISGYGKEVYYKSLSISSVECDFLTTFNSVGINQTLHSLYVEVCSIVKVNYLFHDETISHKTKILVSESIIIGKVPEVYLNNTI